MADQGKAEDAARRAQEATRRAQERTRETSAEVMRITEQMTAAGAETLSVWGSVTQAMADDFMELGAQTMEETARTSMEMRRIVLDAMRETQRAMFRWQAAWPEAMRDPIRWYQRAVEESLGATRRGLELNRRAAEVYAETFQRTQASADQAVNAVGERFKTAASRMQDVTSRIERLRAA